MRLALIACCALLGLVGCFAPERPPSTGRVEHFALTAHAVDETYQLFVRLPPGYDDEPDRRYPLVVQLDANIPLLAEFEVTSGFASTLEKRDEVPPTIVVGIGYAADQASQLRRFRDLALPMENAEFKRLWGTTVPDGAAPQFYEFLRDELMPRLEQDYRLADPAHRALFGHSLGGLFVVYALSRHQDQAPLFTGYVAASPSLFWDGGQIYPHWEQFRSPATPLVLFATAGQLEGPEMVVYFDDFARRTREADFSNFTFETRKNQTDHVGNVAPSFRDGLRFLFTPGLEGAP